MPTHEAPDDDNVRQSYNFAPGYYGLVYRADVPDHGAGGRPHGESTESETPPPPQDGAAEGQADEGIHAEHDKLAEEPHYKLQAMKWGLVPFWTKRNPDYGSLMKTINCRDDSLATNGGMWNTMKQRKRCIVLCQGFYEWLKKGPGGKERVPHYVKRKDGAMMCFAGLWDCVKYEDGSDKLYTYTVITTDSNAQLKFLHDRMPVILDPGSKELFTWLDASRSEWSKDLQSLLKPFEGELECYPVSKEVGKVGNNSPSFIIPVDSTENKQNIANFFGAQKKGVGKTEVAEKVATKEEEDVKEEGTEVQHIKSEDRATVFDKVDDENNAPMPAASPGKGVKRSNEQVDLDGDGRQSPSKAVKMESHDVATKHATTTSRKTRSAISNPTRNSPVAPKDGSKKITSFFKS